MSAVRNAWPLATIGSMSKHVTVGFVGSMSHLFVETGVPLLRGQNVQPYRLDLDGTKFISTSTHAKWRKSALEAGDVVIVRVGYPGTAAVVPEGSSPMNAASLVIVRPDPKQLNPYFLSYVLNSPWGMRSCVARSIIGAGLHPTIGLHHHNRLNGFALADDLVEPFRPLVDGLVRRMIDEGIGTVTSEAKQRLARLIGHDLRLGGAMSPVSVATQRLAQSLAKSFEERKSALALFDPPDALNWASLGQPDGD